MSLTVRSGFLGYAVLTKRLKCATNDATTVLASASEVPGECSRLELRRNRW